MAHVVGSIVAQQPHENEVEASGLAWNREETEAEASTASDTTETPQRRGRRFRVLRKLGTYLGSKVSPKAYVRKVRSAEEEDEVLEKYLKQHQVDLRQVFEDDENGRARRCLLEPRGVLRLRWDMVILVSVLFVAFATPMEVAFVPRQEMNVFLFVANRIIDVLFLLDIVFNFCTPVYSSALRKMLYTHEEIARHYAKSWLLVDVISVIPFDLIALDFEDDDSAEAVVLLNMTKLLRLTKLLRILRASRIIRRWESRLAYKYLTLKLARFVVYLLSLTHWLACGFKLVADFENTEDNWLNAYFASLPEDVKGVQLEYLASLYWAAATVSTIGYGDVVPVTNPERIYSIVAMIIGAGIYAYIIGAICGVIATLDRTETTFYRKMRHMELLLRAAHIPYWGRTGAKRYLFDSKQMQKRKLNSHLLLKLSPDMREQLSLHVKATSLEKVLYIQFSPQSEHRDFVIALSTQLHKHTFPALENVAVAGEPSRTLCVVTRGSLLLNRSSFIPASFNPNAQLGVPQVPIDNILRDVEREVLKSGDSYGTEMIVQDACRRYHVVSLTYCEVQVLHRHELFKILNEGQFPETARAIRKLALKLAFETKAVDAVLKTARAREMATRLVRRKVQRASLRRGEQPMDELNESLTAILKLLHHNEQRIKSYEGELARCREAEEELKHHEQE